MKRIRLIFLILLFLSVSLIINGQKKSGDTAIPKDIAIELLKPAWESMSAPGRFANDILPVKDEGIVLANSKGAGI